MNKIAPGLTRMETGGRAPDFLQNDYGSPSS